MTHMPLILIQCAAMILAFSLADQWLNRIKKPFTTTIAAAIFIGTALAINHFAHLDRHPIPDDLPHTLYITAYWFLFFAGAQMIYTLIKNYRNTRKPHP